MPILHICLNTTWEAAQATGEYHPQSLLTEGFIHGSTLEQVAGSANRYYRGRQDLVLLVIDPALVPVDIRYEIAGDGLAYPHIYGPLPISAVTAVVPYSPGPNGLFLTPTLKRQ